MLIYHFLKNFTKSHWAVQLIVYLAAIAGTCYLLAKFKGL